MAIGSIEELVAAYSGPGRLGRRIKTRGNAVTMWGSRGEIPPGWHLGLYLGLTAAGYVVSPRVFGARTWDDIAIAPPRRVAKRRTS